VNAIDETLRRVDELSERDQDRLMGRLIAMDPDLVNEAIDRMIAARVPGALA
jgi:hypothetical protein